MWKFPSRGSGNVEIIVSIMNSSAEQTSPRFFFRIFVGPGSSRYYRIRYNTLKWENNGRRRTEIFQRRK